MPLHEKSNLNGCNFSIMLTILFHVENSYLMHLLNDFGIESHSYEWKGKLIATKQYLKLKKKKSYGIRFFDYFVLYLIVHFEP